MDAKLVNQRIQELVDSWCERRELGALASLLPAWLSNNGLTDGWDDLCSALRTLSNSHDLPDSERSALKRLWIELDAYLRNR
jgi:hypothetical protein